MASIEDYRAAGLYDPAVDADTGRLDLLEWLEASGFTIEQMVEANALGALGSIAGDRRILPGEQMSEETAIERSGLGADRFAAVTAALGIGPMDPRAGRRVGLTPAEVATVAELSAMASIFSEAEALGFLRVTGSSLTRIAEAAVSLFLTEIESPHIAAQGSELDLARKIVDAVGLLDDLAPLLDPVLRRQVLRSIERSRLSSIDESDRLQWRYAIGFVDLVGFTPLTQAMSPRDLAVFVRDFEGRAHDAVTAVGARLVKLIGDEVMFVAPDPDLACQVAQTLMTTFATTTGEQIRPRGGLAYGEVLVRGGDYYGGVVNLAARLVNEAVPQEVLVSEAFAEATTCLEFEPAGRRMLKGFAEPLTVRSVLFADEPG